MIVLKIKESGHTISIFGRMIRTPALVDITSLNEKSLQLELKKHGVSRYSIEYIPDEQIKKNPKLIQDFTKKEEKIENIPQNTEQIENRLIVIEGLLKQLLNKPDTQNVVYVEAKEKIKEAVKSIEEDIGFIPSVDTDVVIKGPTKLGKIEKEEMDLDKNSQNLARFIKK